MNCFSECYFSITFSCVKNKHDILGHFDCIFNLIFHTIICVEVNKNFGDEW